MIRAGFIVGIIAIIFLFFVQSSHAAPKPRCTDPNPGSTPVITGITTKDTTVTLTWTESVDPVTHYTLAYGPTKEQLIYGAPNIGPKGTSTFTIDQLTKGEKYYFRIRAVNNCEPGSFSDTVSVIVGKDPNEVTYKMPNLSLYKDVLGASTSAQKEKKTVVVPLRQTPYCSACFGVQLLGVQGILLVIFLYISHKIPALRPMYALFIPLLFYLFFKISHQDCNSNVFFCRYYIQMNIILFVFIVIFHKFAFIHKKIESGEDHFIKSINI